MSPKHPAGHPAADGPGRDAEPTGFVVGHLLSGKEVGDEPRRSVRRVGVRAADDEYRSYITSRRYFHNRDAANRDADERVRD